MTSKIQIYNNRFKETNRFLRKYGNFDSNNIKVLNFPSNENELIVIIPFKDSKKDNKKLLIAYKKNNINHYKILKNKKYKKNNKTEIEGEFLNHLNSIFKYSYNEIVLSKNKTLKKGYNC